MFVLPLLCIDEMAHSVAARRVNQIVVKVLIHVNQVVKVVNVGNGMVQCIIFMIEMVIN